MNETWSKYDDVWAEAVAVVVERLKGDRSYREYAEAVGLSHTMVHSIVQKTNRATPTLIGLVGSEAGLSFNEMIHKIWSNL